MNEICSRLIQNAETVLKKKIVSFSPTQNDLLYPQCLFDQQETLAREQAAVLQNTREKVLRHTKRSSTVGAGLLESLVSSEKSAATLFSKPSPAVYASWYAPVRTALDLLATLHTHIPISSLIELGMHVIDASQTAVSQGATLLRDGKYGSDDGVGAVDGYLFQLRHLFVLQELYYSVEIASHSAHTHAANDPNELRLTGSGMHLFGVKVVDPRVVLDTIDLV